MTHEVTSDPFEGMTTSRNTPQRVRPYPYEKPRYAYHLSNFAWKRVGPPDNGSSDAIWVGLVTHLDSTFEDLLPLKTYSFKRTGETFKFRKSGSVHRVTDASLKKSVERHYLDRLRLSKKLFGLCYLVGGYWIPPHVFDGWRVVTTSLRIGTEARNWTRLPTEAAHYAFVHGPPGVAALRATFDLDGGPGLVALLQNWWRL